ncbi:MAG TPA: glycosyl hydrolase family 28 protein [Armatimonadota bacterium]
MRGFAKLLKTIGLASLTLVGQSHERAASAPAPKDVSVPAPKGAALSTDYTVRVNGQDVAVYSAPVWYPDYVKPFGGPYSFASFDFDGRATVEITTAKPLDRAAVLPESRRIHPAVSGRTLSFTLSKPGPLSVEPEGKTGPLLLFANPPERGAPGPTDSKVRYYGPGVHEAGGIELHDGETLYLAAGAVVYGGVHASGRSIRIRGRGILDGGRWERFKGPGNQLLSLDRCENVSVEGIILKDSWSWVFGVTGSRNVRIQNVKVCSSRCENNDGIDIVNSSRVTITDSFIRSDDDCIATKGMGEQRGAPPYPPVEDLRVERCALWTDRAHVWRLGGESRASAMRRLTFRDIDVLHYTDPTCPLINIQPAEGMLMEDVRFERIRVHHEGQSQFIRLDPHPTAWAKSPTPGILRNVVFQDVSLDGQRDGQPGSIVVYGADAAHPIDGVVFRRVIRHGTKLQPDSEAIEVSGEVKNLRFE